VLISRLCPGGELRIRAKRPARLCTECKTRELTSEEHRSLVHVFECEQLGSVDLVATLEHHIRWLKSVLKCNSIMMGE